MDLWRQVCKKSHPLRYVMQLKLLMLICVAMLALDVKNFKKEIEDFKKGDTTFYFDQNEDSGYDISNAQKTCQIAKEKVDQYVQVGDADDSNKNPILLPGCGGATEEE